MGTARISAFILQCADCVRRSQALSYMTHIYISLYIYLYLSTSLAIHIDGCLLAYNTVVAACEGLGLARVVAPVFICNPSGFPTYLAHGSRLQELALEYLYEADVPTFLIQFIQSKKLGRTLPVLPMASAQKTASVLVVWGLSGCREHFWGIRNTGEYSISVVLLSQRIAAPISDWSSHLAESSPSRGVQGQVAWRHRGIASV